MRSKNVKIIRSISYLYTCAAGMAFSVMFCRNLLFVFGSTEIGGWVFKCSSANLLFGLAPTFNQWALITAFADEIETIENRVADRTKI